MISLPRLWVGVALMAAACAPAATPEGGHPRANDDGSNPAPDAGAVAPDGGAASDAGATPPAPVDGGAGSFDAGVLDGGSANACDAPVIDYTCTPGVTGSCPGGQCWFGSCVGPTVDDARFEACGDGACAGCDADAALDTFCPADCAAAPAVAPRDLFDAEVLTVFVHGIELTATPTLMAHTYGSAADARSLGEHLRAMDAALVDGQAEPGARRQLVGVEYYGATPDPALAPEDVAWIEELPPDTPDALLRYARVVAVFVRDRLALTGSRTVNLLCHSMGCAVTRALVEHDLLALSSSGRLARVVGVSGALQGARMANMIDNPYVQGYAGSGAFNIWDIAALDPDAMRARVARWDHELAAADSPLWGGLLIHTLGGSDPTLDEAFNLFSLGAIHNPDDAPHDGVVFSMESRFARQDEERQLVTASGVRRPPSHGFLDYSHNEIVGAPGTAVVVHAALFSRRLVEVRLAAVTLLQDLEAGLAPGDGDSELVLEQRVRLEGVLVDERKLEDRTPALWTMAPGETRTDVLTVFEGPVAPTTSSLSLELSLLEVDRYRRVGLEESTLFEHSAPLVEGTVTVELEGGVVTLSSGAATLTLEARTFDL